MCQHLVPTGLHTRMVSVRPRRYWMFNLGVDWGLGVASCLLSERFTLSHRVPPSVDRTAIHNSESGAPTRTGEACTRLRVAHNDF